MRLVRKGRAVWEVLAIEDHRGSSVWTWLQAEADSGNRHAQSMRVLIRHVLSNGPPESPFLCDSLRDKIYEFKRGPKRGRKLRVLFFYDEGRVIVCTHAFWKDQRTAPNEINKAVAMRRGYFDAKRSGGLEIREERDDAQHSN